MQRRSRSPVSSQEDPSELRPSVILLCDIVGYSRFVQSKQLELVKNLWISARSMERVVELIRDHADTVDMWGTGDGFYLVDGRVREDSFAVFYSIAVDLISLMRSGHGAELRVALLVGNSGRVVVGPMGEELKFLAGSGLNDAERIVSYAAPGQVVFSDEYCQKWDDLTGEVDCVHPDLSEPGLRVYAKHLVPMVVRFNSTVESVRISTVVQIAAQLDKELAAIGRSVVQKFFPAEHFPSLRASIYLLKPRLVRSGKRHLVPINHHQLTERTSPLASKIPKFSIDPAWGLGVCFSDVSQVALTRLPDPHENLVSFKDTLSKELNVDRNIVQRWNWTPRSFFAVPLTLSNEDLSPSGVVCLDLNDPLAEWPKEQSPPVLEYLAVLCESRLTLLSILVE